MVASGYGIAALLPYIQVLIRGYNSCEVRTRRLHLVWLLQEPGECPANPVSIMHTDMFQGDEAIAQDFLDLLLNEDTKCDGYVI